MRSRPSPDAGLSVPGDVSLVTFNDHPFAAHTAPPLTTVRMPNFKMGQEAVRMLLEAFDGKPVEDLMIDDAPEIIARLPATRGARRSDAQPVGPGSFRVEVDMRPSRGHPPVPSTCRSSAERLDVVAARLTRDRT